MQLKLDILKAIDNKFNKKIKIVLKMLPTELIRLIYDYLPLKLIQKLYFANYKLYLGNISNSDNYSGAKILSPFELYCNKSMSQGKIGFEGQFYLPPYVCLLYSARIGDMELVNYYVIRYFDGNR